MTKENVRMQWLYAVMQERLMLVTALGARRGRSEGHVRGDEGDRGDVPGWVMITMMTAIVVIVLLGVFQEAVVTAVRNAFDSISGAGSATVDGGTGAP